MWLCMDVCDSPPGHDWSDMTSTFHLCIKPAILPSLIMPLFFGLFSLFLSSQASILLLVLSCLTSFVTIPLFLRSLSLSSPLSVTLPLFSARCDQLGDISPTDIPGDRTSGGHALLHLSSFCLPSVSPLNTWLSWHSCSSSPSAPLLFMANNRPHSSPEPPPQSCALIPYRADSDISASTLLSSVSSVIYPPFPLPFMFWLHADSDTSPFPSLFPSALSRPTLFQPFLFPVPSPSSISLSPGCRSQ